MQQFVGLLQHLAFVQDGVVVKCQLCLVLLKIRVLDFLELNGILGSLDFLTEQLEFMVLVGYTLQQLSILVFELTHYLKHFGGQQQGLVNFAAEVVHVILILRLRLFARLKVRKQF